MTRTPSISIHPSTVLSHPTCFLLPRFFQLKRTPVSLSSESRLASAKRSSSASSSAGCFNASNAACGRALRSNTSLCGDSGWVGILRRRQSRIEEVIGDFVKEIEQLEIPVPQDLMGNELMRGSDASPQVGPIFGFGPAFRVGPALW